jgi:hypothetical protein
MALPGTSGRVNNVQFEEAIDFAQCRNESRALSLMSLFRVNSGTKQTEGPPEGGLCILSL